MDTVTHLVAGALTPLAFRDAPKTRAAVIFGIVCGEFPDIDIIAGKSPEAILAIHRGITHSLFMLPLFALLLSLLFHRLLRKGDAGNTWTFAKTWLVAFTALCIHVFLDSMTTFGTQIFMPFSHYRAALPAMYIIDLLLTLPLLAAWLYIIWRGGARAPAEIRAPVARGALLWLFAYPLLALAVNYTAAHSLEKRYAAAGNERGITSVELLPEPFAPFNWKVVGIAPDAYHMASFFTPDWGGEIAFTPYRRPDAALTEKLLESVPLFPLYDAFATYIFTEERREGDETVLSLKDVRYEATLPGLFAAVGRGDGIFILQVRMKEGAPEASRFLYRGRDAATTPWTPVEDPPLAQ